MLAVLKGLLDNSTGRMTGTIIRLPLGTLFEELQGVSSEEMGLSIATAQDQKGESSSEGQVTPDRPLYLSC